MFNCFKKSLLIFLYIGMLPSVYAMDNGHETKISGNKISRFISTVFSTAIVNSKRYIQSSFSYLLYNTKTPHFAVFDGNGNTPLNAAIKTGNLHLAEYLLQHGANPNQEVRIPLIRAVEYQNLDMVKLLLQYNADINASDKNGNTPLSAAIETGNLQLVEYLLQHGANPNIKNGWADPNPEVKIPLVLAVKHQNLDMVKLLLQYNAGINASDSYGNTPLSAAINTDNLQMVIYLLENKADPNAVNQTFPLMMFKVLGREGADINHSYGYAPLSIAIGKGNFEIAKYLLQHGANPNIKTGWFGKPFLVRAVDSRNLNMINLLLQYMDINHCNSDGQTPLYELIRTYDQELEAINYNLEAIKLLCNAGVSLINIEKLHNSSAFHIAISSANIYTLKKQSKKYIETFITYTRFNDLPSAAKDPLAQVYKRIICLKEILQMQNDQNQTALDLLHIDFNADNYPNDIQLIQEVELLLNGTKLDDDFNKLETALKDINSESKTKLNATELISALESKLDSNNLALQMYKNCASLENDKWST